MNSSLIPRHIAIIPDGNRRWAKERHLPSFMGHREGAKTTEKILTRALDRGVENLTFWGCSVDNVVKRDKEEVHFLLELFGEHFKRLLNTKIIHERKVNVQFFGLWREYFPQSLQKIIEELIATTAGYSDHYLTFMMAYSGILEMTQAVQKIMSEQIGLITPETIKEHLYTAKLPPVDLTIRTGGEPHLSSGFMMWDMADTQLHFTETLWPAFSSEDFDAALATFAATERRQGK